MAEQTPQEYYSDESNWGQYQYVTLKSVIDALMLEAMDDDSYLKNTKRSKMLYHAKQGIRELTRSVANDVLAFEITVPNSLVFPIPQDYLNYVRISVVKLDNVTGSYRLHPLDVNHNIHSAIGYLQDNDAQLLFDQNGYILTADSLSAVAKPYKRYYFSGADAQFTTDASKFSKFGEVKIDERRGLILFDSSLAEQTVVIEYVSDGLQSELSEEEITIHKYIKKALEDYIYYECLAGKRNVPANEKERARRQFKTSRHKASIARADFDLLRISRTLRTYKMIL